MRQDLSDVIDPNRIQKLTDSFYAATDIHSAIFTIEGESVAASGWRDICANFHRKNPLTGERCRECTTLLRNNITAGKSWDFHHCSNGLACAAVPIVVGGDLVANTCGGQILSCDPSEQTLDHFKRQAREFGFREDQYLDALSRVPVMSESQMRAALNLLAWCVELLIEMEISHQRQQRDGTRYQIMTEKAADCVIVHDMDGRIVYINEKGRNMSGYSREEIRGVNIFNLILPDCGMTSEECRERWLRLHDEPCLHRANIINKKGGAIPVEVNSSLIDRGENAPEILVIARDVTAYIKAENELKESREHIRLINKILRHDIVNNLSVIKSALNLYRDTGETVLLDEASGRVGKSCALISRMMNLENIIASHRKLWNYHAADLCERVLKNYASLTYSVTGECPVRADEALESVVDNIVSNAIIHGKSDRMDVTICREGDVCRIRFSDNGCGIPDAFKERVFDERFTGEAVGHSGVGLFIVKKVMERYGGCAHIENNTPRGTVVVLTMQAGA